MNELISRQAVKDIIFGGVSTDTDADKEYVCGLIDNLPSVDIMECAKAIKEYCNQFSKCEDCGCLNKKYCAFYTCPDEWHLPEGEKE